LVLNDTNANVGRSNEELQAELELQTKRALLAALQNSNLPKELADYLNSINAATATSAQIDTMLKFADALKAVSDAFSGDVIADGVKAFTDASKGAQGALKEQGKALRDLITNFDKSADSATALAAATKTYYQTAVAIIQYIEDIKKQVKNQFGDNARYFQTQGMASGDKYQFLQAEVARLQAELLTTTDATRIREIASQIAADQREAFGLLTPEQQNSMRQQFIDAAQEASDLVTEQLTQAENDIAADTKALITDVRAAMLDAMVPLTDASNKFDTAVDKFVDATNTPITVNVAVENPSVNGG
jgi:hypothetical protein